MRESERARLYGYCDKKRVGIPANLGSVAVIVTILVTITRRLRSVDSFYMDRSYGIHETALL